MKTVYILMGVLGAGKSTRAKQISKETQSQIISYDEIRKEFIKVGIIPEVYDSKYNYIVFNEMYARLNILLENNVSAIFDHTNIPTEIRKPIIEIAKKNKAKIVGEILLVDDQTSLKRIHERELNDKNSHIIINKESAIKIVKERLKNGLPTIDEGFHEINTYFDGKLIKKETALLIATSNIGKINIYGSILNKHGIKFITLQELDINIKVEENGESEIDNAVIKALAYNKETNLPVLSNDSGLYLHKLKPEDQPGMFVRRLNGKEVSDTDLLIHYCNLIENVGGETDAHYNVGLALIDNEKTLKTDLFKPVWHFVSKPSRVIKKGVPLNSIAYDYKSQKYLSEMTDEEKNNFENIELLKQEKFIVDNFTNTTIYGDLNILNTI